jgi:hypothetical protein
MDRNLRDCFLIIPVRDITMINIELAPEKSCIRAVSYDEAVLYCFQLVIDGKTGWRLPTMGEYYNDSRLFLCWYVDDQWANLQNCIPVRDIV